MTRMRQLALGGAAAALITAGAVSQSFADVPGTFDNRLWGATIGAPLAAAPPTGLYSGLENMWAGMTPAALSTGNQGANRVGAWVAAVPLVWSPGWNFLGASYYASVVQAWYQANVSSPQNCAGGACATISGVSPAGTITAVSSNIANTYFNPLTLSWNLGSGYFGALAFAFAGPDGSHFAGSPTPDYWTFEIGAYGAYLANNWVIAINAFYDFNTASKGNCCAGAAPAPPSPFIGWTPPEQLFVDWTVAYKIGKWEIGPVGYWQVDTTNDSPGSGFTCATLPAGVACGHLNHVGLGGLIGYDFGPVDVRTWVTWDVSCANTAGCDGAFQFWSSIGFRLWGPEAPAAKPLVSKN